MADSKTAELSAIGVSIWLDDLSRELLETGKLTDLIAQKNVVGVTTNPTIFASALAKGERYDAQVKELAAAGTDVTEAIFEKVDAPSEEKRRILEVLRQAINNIRSK